MCITELFSRIESIRAVATFQIIAGVFLTWPSDVLLLAQFVAPNAASAATEDGGAAALVDKADSSRLAISEAPRLHAVAILPPRNVPAPAIIRVRIAIRCNARNVLLVWGLDEFRKVPTTRPDGTFLTLNGSHLNTPMNREGDEFVAELDVEENDRLDYGFMMTPPEGENPPSQWRGSNSQGEYYVTVFTRKSADELRMSSADEWRELAGVPWQDLHVVAYLPSRHLNGEKPRIKFHIEYHDDEASKVTLVWGLNNWMPFRKINELPSGTTLTYNNTHMNTPMQRKGDLFVFDYEADDDTQLDYAFIVTQTADGSPAEIWNQDDRTGRPYSAILSAAHADEVIHVGTGWTAHGVLMLVLSFGVTLFFVVRLARELSRKKQGVDGELNEDESDYSRSDC